MTTNRETAPPRRLRTRNRMGWASEQLGAVSGLFVEYCRESAAGAEAGAVLDVGAAFGTASLAALGAGATVIANDLDAEHLAELERRAKREFGEAASTRLRLKPGRFPRGIHFEPESLSAVHASNVFHFLTGNQLEAGMRAVARWLRPGGKLFAQAATPYQSPFAAFISEYQRRVESGVKWPGWLEKVGAYSSHRQLSQMPRSIHLLDAGVLTRAAEAAGMTVERAWFYRLEDLPASLHWDGRETVGIVARKGG